jgi:hypothetical protein
MNSNSVIPILEVLREHFISRKQLYLTSLDLQQTYGFTDLDEHLGLLKSEGVNLVKIELLADEVRYFIANDEGLIVHTPEQLKEVLMMHGRDHGHD